MTLPHPADRVLADALAFSQRPTTPVRCRCGTVFEGISEPIILVVPNDHTLASADTVTLQDLNGLPLALPDVTFGVRRIFDRAVQEAGLAGELNPALTSNSFEALRDFVRCGAGVAILPYRAVLRESTHKWLKAVSIDHPMLTETTIDIITLRKQRPSRVVTTFIEQLIRTLGATAARK
jgi:DNA-binding transcriptional LysR family regulator